jgi:putative mRNA 3-end processing factor
MRIDTGQIRRNHHPQRRKVSFHPAGHVPGSAQIRVEPKAKSGLRAKPSMTAVRAFERPVPRLHHQIDLQLPVFNWIQTFLAGQINDWVAQCREWNLLTVVVLRPRQGATTLRQLTQTWMILTHGAIENTNRILRAQGITLPDTTLVTPDLDVSAQRCVDAATPSALEFNLGALVLMPQAPLRPAGWRCAACRRRAADRGFIVSDHADWVGLNDAV